jgi:hypothetical protein
MFGSRQWLHKITGINTLFFLLLSSSNNNNNNNIKNKTKNKKWRVSFSLSP